MLTPSQQRVQTGYELRCCFITLRKVIRSPDSNCVLLQEQVADPGWQLLPSKGIFKVFMGKKLCFEVFSCVKNTKFTNHYAVKWENMNSSILKFTRTYSLTNVR